VQGAACFGKLVCGLYGNIACVHVVACLQVIDIPNSMTVLPELIPYSIQMVSGGRG
jgi:hypothetical protein